MQTRTINSLNQLTQMGGAGDVVVAGHVNERSAVTVNGQAAVMQADPVSNGVLFRKPISVTPGSNTVEISAVDEDDPPNTTTQSWSFTVPPLQRTFECDASGNLTSDSNGRSFTWDAKNCPSLRSRPAKWLRIGDAAVAAGQWLKRVTVAGMHYEWDYDYRDGRVREFVYASGGSKPSVPAKQFVWHDNEIVQQRGQEIRYHN